jgi:hypothetical protein
MESLRRSRSFRSCSNRLSIPLCRMDSTLHGFRDSERLSDDHLPPHGPFNVSGIGHTPVHRALVVGIAEESDGVSIEQYPPFATSVILTPGSKRVLVGDLDLAFRKLLREIQKAVGQVAPYTRRHHIVIRSNVTESRNYGHKTRKRSQRGVKCTCRTGGTLSG